jgi:zinc transport system substrate-binding protein
VLDGGMKCRYFILLALLPMPALADSPVAVTIEPLHALVSAVMEGEEVPTLLVEGMSSPHEYRLKPSQARALQEARMIFAIGAQLEPFLAPLAKNGAPVVSMADMPGIALLPRRSGEGMDPHLWLDPKNAMAMADIAATRLGEAFPEHAGRYRANAEALKIRLAALDTEIAVRLKGFKGRRFLLFHDATHYFEHAYGLEAMDTIMADGESGAHAGHVAQLRKRVAEGGTACIFIEPGYRGGLAKAVAGDAPVRIVTLDAEGMNVTPGAGGYEALMQGIAAAFEECLR